jgi:cell surface protein SprA
MNGNTSTKKGLFFVLVWAVASSYLFGQNPASQDSLLLAQNLQHISLKQKPSSFVTSYSYDPKLNLYFYNVKVGEINAEQPLVLTPAQYRKRVMAEQTRAYAREKQQALAGLVDDEETQQDLLPDYYVNSKFFEKIFGSNEINIRPQGSASIDLGLRYQKSGNPSLSPRNQSSLNFDFNQRINLSLSGTIGTRLKVNANYDTQSTFDFQRVVKLDFFPEDLVPSSVTNTINKGKELVNKGKNLADKGKDLINRGKNLAEQGISGNEDSILQKLEVGNVNMPLNSSLISGAQSLFGVKAQLKFGNTNIAAVISEQRSQTQTIQTNGEGTLEEFSLFALDYEDNRHFFLAQYFRDTYDKSVKTYPYINSPIQITRLEVWVTNRSARTSNVRNILALQDLGETNPDATILDNIAPGFFNAAPGAFPSNSANKLDPLAIGSTGLLTSAVRDIATVQSGFGTLSAQVSEGRDYAVLESARKLNQTEYRLHEQLGYISLNQPLNNDEVLAVAFQYTVNGQAYQVGEFAGDGVAATTVSNTNITPVVNNNNLVLKMLKSSVLDVAQPVFDLMMKNVYNIGAFQLEQEDFVFNIMYTDPSPANFIRPEDEASWPSGTDERILLNLFGLDRLNIYQDAEAEGDGFFDYISGITVIPEQGQIIFPSVEPFGKYLFELLKSNDPQEDYSDRNRYNKNQKKYVYKELYDITKADAADYQRYNKFELKGRYKSSGGGQGISLGAFNVPRGSVRVTAGGRLLQEGMDYTVNYQLGRVTILNESIKSSNIPIEVSTESNSLFGQQNRRFMGFTAEHKVNDDLLLGGTYLRLSERPLTQKANYGTEPVNNSMFGLSGTFSKEIPFLTRMVNKLPNIDTQVASNVSIRAEAAYLNVGAPRGTQLNNAVTTYIDDFEGTQTNLDIRDTYSWYLSSVPAPSQQLPIAGSNVGVDDISSGYQRAKLAWYNIDPLFYSRRRPSGITDNDLSTNATRRIFVDEIFPQQDIVQGQSTVQYTFDLAYYPAERGPYNNAPSFGASPEDNWAGITRPMTTTDFAQSNVEYIEFWLLDTFSDQASTSNDLGELVFHLGNISEDVLKDGRKQYENGLPTEGQTAATYNTSWGITPVTQSLVYAFDADGQNRALQDVGLDGLTDDEERLIYTNGPTEDPAGDNYTYFGQGSGSILDRYKNYNGTQGNSPLEVTEQFRGSYTTPDAEDLNQDNTMNTIDRYFQYRIPIGKNMQVGTHPFLFDVRETNDIELPNGQVTTARWLQFRIPVVPDYYEAPVYKKYFEPIGGMEDLRSIRFMRMLVSGFKNPTVFRFGTLDIVRADWTRVPGPLNTQEIPYPNTQLEVSAVNILENETRTPIRYKLPPGIVRETLNSYNNLIRENEQSLSLRVKDLEPKDAEGVYKHIDLDMRQYKRLRMFLHAESLTNENPLPGEGAQEEFDKRMVAFIRLGTDISENYYQIEIPLKPTAFKAGVSNNLSAEEIWQNASNEIDIPVGLLTKLKAKSISNRQAVGATYFDEDLNPISEFTPISSLPGAKKYKLAIRGNPTLGAIRTLVVGVKNPNTKAGEKLSGEVWFNELRLSEIDSQGGWAALGALDANLADFANVTVNGAISTVGFGAIDQSPNQRSQDDTRSYGVTTSVNAGMLFPEKWGLVLPVNYSYNQEVITPKYDPYYRDIELQDRLDTAERESQRDSIREQAISVSKLKSINLIGVRKQRSAEAKEDFFDVENFDFSYAYNEEKRHDFEIEDYAYKNVRLGAGYNYSFKPLSIKPLGKVDAISSKQYLRWLSELNLNLMPSSVTLGANINRTYQSQRFRQVYLEGVDNSNQIALPDLQQRNYLFDWLFTVNHNLTNSLRLDFSASSRNIVRNYLEDGPAGTTRVNKELDIWDGLWDMGQMDRFDQTFGATYQFPFRLIPILSFLNGTYSYNGNFNWQRGANSLANVVDENNNALGIVHTLQNANTIQWNGNANMRNLYSALGLRKKTGNAAKNKPGVKIKNTLVGLVTALERVQFTYSENNGTVLPGYTQNIGFLGTQNPGLEFALGRQKDIRFEAAKRGWLTEFPNFNQAYTTVHNTDISYNATIGLLQGLQLDLTGNRSYSENNAENFSVVNGVYNALSPRLFGNFEISTIMLRTAFSGSGLDSQAFSDLKTNRLIVAQRLAAIQGVNPGDIDADGFPKGFGKNNQAVLIPAFLAAYTGENPNSVSFDAKRSFPLPNWNMQYTGLMRLKSFKKRFNRFAIAHGYRASHTLNAFTTNLEYQPNGKDQSGNFMNKILYTNVNLVEQFNPIMKVDFELKNSLQVSAEVRKDRALSLSLDNNLLTETSGDEWIVGLGYRIKDVKFKTNVGGKSTNLKGDINIKGDLSVRDNITLIRNLDLMSDQVTAGQRLWSLKVSADYALSRNFTALFFYDHVFSKFAISTAFPQTNIRSGITLRYNFGN